MRALRSLRAALAAVLAAATLTGIAATSVPSAQAKSISPIATYQVTLALSVHAKASSSGVVLGTIAVGNHVLAAGSAGTSWLPVSYAGTTGYVSLKRVSPDATAATVVITGPSGKKIVLKKSKLRVKAIATARVTTLIAKGTIVKVTGATSGTFTKVTAGKRTGWAVSTNLSATSTASPTKAATTPTAVASYTTTSSQVLRASASLSAKSLATLPAGTVVSGTGTSTDGYSQVIANAMTGWVITGFLKAADGTDARYVLPLWAETAYATSDGVPILAAADASATVIDTVTSGTPLRSTGTTTDGYLEVIWNGTGYWVDATKVTVSLGTTSLDKLEVYGKAAVIAVRHAFPEITTMYGWRATDAYSPDHPNGRAVDFMIPNYKTNVAYGDSVAQYFIDNFDTFHVTYIIWRQRIYTSYSKAWRAMEDRGSDTANHMNHVHVSFEPSAKS